MAKKDTVSLNGVEYFVRGPVIAQPVSDFAANIRIGEPSYETRQGAGYIVIDDLTGGPGILQGLAREDLARFADTDGADTRIGRQLTSPLAASAGSGPGAPASSLTINERIHIRQAGRSFQHFIYNPLGTGMAVYDVFAYGHRIFYQRPADASLAWAGLDIGLDCIFDMAIHKPVTGTYKGDDYIFVVGKSGWRRINLLP